MSFSEIEPAVQSRDDDPSGGNPPELDAFVMADPFATPPDVDRLEAAALDVATRAGSVFERYQKLLAQTEGVRDHESAILAAVDSAILAAPASSASPISALASHEDPVTPLPTPESLPPARPRLLSFNVERDVDWNEEAAAPEQPANESPEPSTLERAAAEPAPLPRPDPSRARKRTQADSPGWSAFLGGLACALAVGFALGVVAGRKEPSSLEARVSSAVVEPLLPSATAEPLLPGPEPSEPTADLMAPPPIAGAASAARATGVPYSAPSEPIKLPNMEFDAKSALAALGKAAGRAGVCVPPGEPGGSVVATVTFARTGHASSVGLSEARFSGSYSSECIRKVLAELKVRPFLGDSVTVRKTLTIH